MLGNNIKALRKSKGITQQELAIKLNVVRQTISKWEKGFSVPDAEMLQKMADILETDAATLLGAATDASPKESAPLAEQLSRLNEQLVIKNRRSRRICQVISILLLVMLLLNALQFFFGAAVRFDVKNDDNAMIVLNQSDSPSAP